MNARTVWFMQPMKKGSSTRLGWLYCGRKAWTTACLLTEGETEDKGTWYVIPKNCIMMKLKILDRKEVWISTTISLLRPLPKSSSQVINIV